jgi:hypothetical protein
MSQGDTTIEGEMLRGEIDDDNSVDNLRLSFSILLNPISFHVMMERRRLFAANPLPRLYLAPPLALVPPQSGGPLNTHVCTVLF